MKCLQHMCCTSLLPLGLQTLLVRLVEAGCDVNERDARNCTPLYYACIYGYLDIARELIENNALVDAQGGVHDNALNAASYHSNVRLVRMMLERNADYDIRIGGNRGGPFGNALHTVSYRGYGEIVKILLAKGADVNTRGGPYGNALQAASCGGYKEIVKMLLKYSADVNAQGGIYGTALLAASSLGYKEIVKILLDYGADVDAQGGEFESALTRASKYRHTRVVRLLLDAGANTAGVDLEWFYRLEDGENDEETPATKVMEQHGTDWMFL